METKIYYNENKSLIYDGEALDEFNSLVSELGLKCNNVKDNEKSPIPFMWLDDATQRAFRILCPKTDEAKNYPNEIPLEALRSLKLCETEKYFDVVEVWSNRKDPDPFLIGRVYKNDQDRKNAYSWNRDAYLIARWGDESLEVNQLVEKALTIATERIKTYTSAVIAKMKSWQECPEVWAKNYISDNNSEAQKAFGGSEILPF